MSSARRMQILRIVFTTSFAPILGYILATWGGHDKDF